MALKVEIDYRNGIPQTAVPGFAPTGLVWHWTAGATGRAGAEATIRHFINTRYTTNASYHILLFREGSTTVAKWIVPMSRAAHSMNPGAALKPKTGSARERARIEEVKRILGSRATDPNAGSIAISFCGMPADLAAAMKDAGFRADVRALAQQLIDHPNFIVARPHFGHGWVQPTTRYETDATPEGADLLIASLYGEASLPDTSTGANDMYDWVALMKPASFKTTIAAGSAIRKRPRYKDAKVAAETLDFYAGRDSTITVIGTVEGDEYNGTVTWLAYVLGDGGLRVTSAGNELPNRRAPLEREVVKEVIKEVPTGISEEDVQQAQEAAAEAERARIAAAEAQRIKSI